MAQSQQEHAEISTVYVTAKAQVAALEATLRALEQQNAHIQEAAQMVENTAHARIDELSTELHSLQSMHSVCNNKVRVRLT